MRILVDMNLSPAWVHTLRTAGWETVHWSTTENPSAPDTVIFAFAREHHWTVFTNDLDFGTLLAHTRSGAPSVFQIRAQNLSPDHLAPLVIKTLLRFTPELESGSLVTVDEQRQRVRLLPLT